MAVLHVLPPGFLPDMIDTTSCVDVLQSSIKDFHMTLVLQEFLLRIFRSLGVVAIGRSTASQRVQVPK